MGDRWHPITEEEIDYAVQLVIEEGMKPAPAARKTEERFRQNSWKSIANKITKDLRYIEYVQGKPESATTIPMSVLEGVHKIVTDNPKMPIMTCIQKYKEESGCQFPDESIRGKYRRVMGGADGVKRGRYKTGLDSSDCILDLSIDELVRRGYLSRAKE